MVMVCARVLSLFSLTMLLVPLAASSENMIMTKPNCSSQCGDLSVPYPFGIGPGCARPGFAIDCVSTNGTMTPYLGGTNTTVFNISLLTGELQANSSFAHKCHNETYQVGYNETDQVGLVVETRLDGTGTFLFSSTRNKFTAIGCDTLALIRSGEDRTASVSGCISLCEDKAGVDVEGPCSGRGCCQTRIPGGLESIATVVGGLNNSEAWNFSPCSYAFLTDDESFSFTTANLGRKFVDDKEHRVRTVLDWAIRSPAKCEEARFGEDYACRSKNSSCYETANGLGYLCNCSNGYEGNPYLDGGCANIDECDEKHHGQYPCYGKCVDLPGSYKCSCPDGQSGNATIPNGCRPDNLGSGKFPLGAKLAIGTSGGLVLLIVISSFALMRRQKIKYLGERDDFFKKNGGLKLYEEMRSRQVDTVQIYTLKDLENATDNFDKERVIGFGGHGMVYKGILEDKRTVAIKKSRILDETEKEGFVNEIIILSQINHRNVVRLLGCCLEADVPMLVYEFVSNGTLFNLIHNKHSRSRISLLTRLKIAAESAEALAYLHSSTFRSIIHGDVKSANILLDEKLMAKVSDFGASQIVPMDEKEFVNFVQGTIGYLDPECLQTQCLTEKSDVYSFGVVLLELLTGQKATEGFRGKKNLASSFILVMNEHRVRDILDEEVLEEGDLELCLEVADLAMQCLNVKGAERPMMKEVADRLQSLRRFKQHPWGLNNPEEFESLQSESSTHTKPDPTKSMEKAVVFDIEIAR